MAKKSASLSVRDRFVSMTAPAKALVFVAVVGVTALVVAAIVVSGVSGRRGARQSPDDGAAPSADSTAATALVSTSGPTPFASGSAGASGTASVAAAAGSGSGKTAKNGQGQESANGKTAGPSSTQETSATNEPPAPPVLTTDLRKQIAAEFVSAEKRAVSEAAAKYPVDPKKGGTAANSAKYEQMRSDLIDSYSALIVNKYHLTTEQTIDILILDAAMSD